MEALLELFLFSVLLTSGTSLDCESCTAVSRTCSGSQITCPGGLDTCAVSLTETSRDPVKVDVTVKGCTSSSSCTRGPIYANFGLGKSRGSVVCCTGSACKSTFPELPPINTTANGKHCPACYSLTGSCVTQVAYCTGSENYCLDAEIRDPAGTVDIIMKGCASEQLCAGLQDGMNTLGTTTKGHCQAANEGSTASRSILLVLSGLLVMSVFF